MVFGRNWRLPRKWATEKCIVVRESDGRAFKPHHNGAASMAALFGGPQFWFTPMRRWRGQWVCALDWFWCPANASEFRVITTERPYRVRCVGRKVTKSINVGGLA